MTGMVEPVVNDPGCSVRLLTIRTRAVGRCGPVIPHRGS